MEIITSVQNTLIKEAKKLRQKKYREEAGLFLIEGVRLLEEALNYGQVEQAFYDESLLKTERGQALLHKIEENVPQFYQVGPQVLSTLAETETPQGIVAVAKKNVKDMEAGGGESEGIILICDGIQDPGNLGTMIRTAWAAGVDALVCLPGTVDPYNGKVVRATMGGIFQVPIITDLTWCEVLKRCHERSYQVIAGDLDGVRYDTMPYSSKVALVIGNEGQGLLTVGAQDLDGKVMIPLKNGAESLNAAVACGILLYEIVLRRNL